MTGSGPAETAERFREQAAACRDLGSPLYARLLEETASDVVADGPAWAVLQGRHIDTPLRFMAAMHRLVLTGRAPELARFYPSAGGDAGGVGEDPWPAFLRTMREHRDEIRELLDLPCQTNEVGRCAALLGGFLLVARETGLRLALAEIGASAGLNLRWDRYRYECADAAWGEPASPVRFEEPFSGPHPPFDVRAKVVERRGCDLQPLDPASAEDRLTLRSSVWADQVDRMRRLEAALEVAARVPAMVERAEATEWLSRRLADTRPGAATVVFHSIVSFYLSASARARIRELLEDAGSRATARDPVAWLRMEHMEKLPDGGRPPSWTADVRLTVWPGGEERVIATSPAHGPPVTWLGPA